MAAATTAPGAGEITDEQLDTLRQQAEQRQVDADALREALQDRDMHADRATTAQAALLEATRASHPNIPPDLIAGDTPDALAASVQTAQGIVQQVVDANPPPKPDDPQPKPPPAPTSAASPPRDPTPVPEGVRGESRIRAALDAQKET